MPAHAEQVLDETARDAFAAVLADAEREGHDPAILLQQAAGQRPLDDARSPTEVLTWRIQRLGERHAPGPNKPAATLPAPDPPRRPLNSPLPRSRR
ncbi:hypothetical protein [Streptomyces sp. NPDC048581]|uniref:hypothetical protein n=1 Tax=unclassified Streptomyces TaxID=2593676 RepID=UPI003713B89A